MVGPGRPRKDRESRQSSRKYADEPVGVELQPVEFVPGFIIPEPPLTRGGNQLRPYALLMWDRYWLSDLPRALDGVDGVDVRVVHEWILLINELVWLEQEVEDSSPLVKGSTGNAVLNPLYRRIERIQQRIDRCEEKLGGNPRARARLGIVTTPQSGGGPRREDSADALNEELDSEIIDGEWTDAAPLEALTVADLRRLARQRGIEGVNRMRKATLVELLAAAS